MLPFFIYDLEKYHTIPNITVHAFLKFTCFEKLI